MILIKEITNLDFNGKGEAFVEQKFITPLLEALGYEHHRDYEVVRHGDNNASFKVKYPPVEQGAKTVKHYNPDYIPTIRKKMFWVIEAKSPSVEFPFEYKYIVQGLQYCLHPEIQAQYLVISNGVQTSIYAPLASLVLEREIYEPILSFSSKELLIKWKEVHGLLSVERLRENLEIMLQQMYEKISLSSLDINYPQKLASQITSNKDVISAKIEKHITHLYCEKYNKERSTWQEQLRSLSYQDLYRILDNPLGVGKTVADYYVEKALLVETPDVVYSNLIKDYEKQSIFRKEQTFVGLCVLFNSTSENKKIKTTIESFIKKYADGELKLNVRDCGFFVNI
ncbi:type I restriction enzyme HsdR N-terminal domain-containing protein [Propionispora vibrioides]|uniref:Type I restriction enzyme R protein N terminus (HSDR_N) n=1 Tax=Propionispora vibrioides TaxID=112903 RepID=A0A1H8Y3M9_9FIRM|nr:type I restriction enzyme HsdR N-terminal domain-containing protein [Propionispora vibrioides]SEP46874.1 Type I restriction enzyme R protein N terminus (HSDR_N) [Propionispora vibrioides]